MLTKPEFLAALKRETKILNHLAGKLREEHLGFRFTPPQRSTLELLQYLTIGAEAGVGYYLNGSWDHWEALESRSKDLSLAGFAAALKAQERNVARLLKPVSDKAFLTRTVKPMMGKGKATLSQALADTTMCQAVGYRMQLFLQAKAAGLHGLGSSDLWAGRDAT